MSDYKLDIAYHRTGKGTQLRGAGASLGRRALGKFGIAAPTSRGEYGRTSRGGPRAAERLLDLLEPLQLDKLSAPQRAEFLLSLEKRMVEDALRIQSSAGDSDKIEIDYTITTEQSIHDALANVPGASSGALAQHLVGAKLQLRYPHRSITNHPSAAADAPTDRPGDFEVENTVFHVTMAPQPAVYEKCEENLNEGHRVYLLVPEQKLASAKKDAERRGLKGKIVIKAIESFVGQNLDELGEFSEGGLAEQEQELVRIYTRRVQEAHEIHAPKLVVKDRARLEVEGNSGIEQGEV